MKIAYITNLRAPYRTLQLDEFSKIENVELTAYYTDKPSENRGWNINKPNKFSEIDLKGFKIAGKFGYINKGLIDIVKKSDLVMLGCYEQPTYILISILCRVFNKAYILSFDGISTNRLKQKENLIKKYIKNIVIKNSNYIMGNGIVSKRYFNEIFNYPLDRIYNQYLTVDSEKIDKLYQNREVYRKELRNKLGISEEKKVLIYSGRLIDIKNVDSVIRAISNLKDDNIIFLITGGGKLEEELKRLSQELDVNTIITGFISEQEELFKYYFAGDALILPSKYEPWGLVVNEAMFSGLPVLVSKVCGCSLDLINNKNGFIIDENSISDITKKIRTIMYRKSSKEMGDESRRLIRKWTCKSSKENLIKILIKLGKI